MMTGAPEPGQEPGESLEPGFALLIGFIVLSEEPDALAVLGIACVVRSMSTTLISLSSRTAAAAITVHDMRGAESARDIGLFTAAGEGGLRDRPRQR